MKNLAEKIVYRASQLLIIYLFISSAILKADIYNEITVEGNERLSVETVLMFSGLTTGINLENSDLNSAIKKLYDTDYFKNVEIQIKDNELLIKLEENPIIQSIEIKGIKNKSIIKQLKEITKKSEKYP